MAETDAEDRQLTGKSLDALDRDAGLGRRAGTGRDDQVRRPPPSNLIAADLVIAMDLDRQSRAHFAQALDEVVSKRVVVVDEQDQGSGGREPRCESSAQPPTIPNTIRLFDAHRLAALRGAGGLPVDRVDIVRDKRDMAVAVGDL